MIDDKYAGQEYREGQENLKTTLKWIRITVLIVLIIVFLVLY